MAPAAAGYEDDVFVEYNPHPYQGGYDIALTYGLPLPPSTATCYSLPHSPPPEPSKEGPSSSPPLADAVPSPEQHQHQPQAHGYGDLGCDYRYYYPEQWQWPPEPYYSAWPTSFSGEHGYRNPLRRAADYLFGYSQGCGEKIIGMDGYGIPIYANKREAHEQAISMRLQPAPDLKVHYNEANDAYHESHQKYTDTRPLLMERETTEIDECRERHYSLMQKHCIYQEQAYPQLDWCSSMTYDGRPDVNQEANPCYVHARIDFEEPLNIQSDLLEPSWNQSYTYHEDTGKHSYPQYDPDHQGNYCEQYQASQFDHLEPYEPTWSRMQGYYEVDYYYGKNGAQSSFPLEQHADYD